MGLSDLGVSGLAAPAIKEVEKISEKERFDAQCFLIDNWKLFAFKNDTIHIDEPYKNFIMMLDDPIEGLHTMVGKDAIDALINITPAQKALLVPKIKIWKVDYTVEKTSGIDNPLIFSDHTTSRTIENILTSRSGRGDDVGLKSFSYKLAGKNPAEGGTAEAELKIHFQNASALVRKPERGAPFVSLILPEGRWTESKDKSRAWNDKHFRIKIEAGWSVPEDPTEAVINKELRKAIERSSAVLFMTLVKHNLDFNQDGSLNLNVIYRGAIESALASEKSNIFYITEAGRDAKKLLNNVAETRKKRLVKKKQPTDKKAKVPPPSEDKNIIKPYTGTAVEQNEEKRRLYAAALQTVDNQKKWSRIINKLIEESFLYYIDIDKEHVKGLPKELKNALLSERKNLNLSVAEVEALDRNAKEENRRLVSTTNSPGFLVFPERVRVALKATEIVRYGKKDAKKLNSNIITQKAIKEGGNDLERKRYIPLLRDEKWKRDPKISKNVVKKAVQDIGSVVAPKKDKIRVNFFYFGDLLEVVLDVLKGADRDDAFNMNVMLGTLALFDPRNPNQKDPYYVNIADIPISLELFQVWYLRKVVAQQRQRYMLSEFIKDVLETLVVPALGERCFLDANGKTASRISMTTFTVPGVTKGDLRKVGTRLTPALLRERNIAGGIKDESSPYKATKDLESFLYIYASNWPMKSLYGDREADAKRGIYHLYVGNDRGLVKSIKFNKIDQPYVAETRATADSNVNKRLRERYNATVEMIGNNLFKPGMYVYIDTQTMSNDFGNPSKESSLSYQLGLGGYFVITSVSQATDGDGHTTSLECSWQHNGSRSDKKSAVKLTSASQLRYNALSKVKQQADKIGIK